MELKNIVKGTILGVGLIGLIFCSGCNSESTALDAIGHAKGMYRIQLSKQYRATTGDDYTNKGVIENKEINENYP